MSGPNRGGGGNNNNRPGGNQSNYFDQNKKQFGPEFMRVKTALDLQRDAERIFREMAKGYINPPLYIEYFSDPQFLAAMNHTANRKYAYYKISLDGVNLMIQSLAAQGYTVDSTVYGVRDEHHRSTEAYTVVLNMLNVFNASLDPYSMIPFIAELRKYKGAL